MEQFDSVRLTEDFNGLKKGTEGAVLDIYWDGFCEVEFFDEKGNTIEVCPVDGKILEVVVPFKEMKGHK